MPLIANLILLWIPLLPLNAQHLTVGNGQQSQPHMMNGILKGVIHVTWPMLGTCKVWGQVGFHCCMSCFPLSPCCRYSQRCLPFPFMSSRMYGKLKGSLPPRSSLVISLYCWHLTTLNYCHCSNSFCLYSLRTWAVFLLVHLSLAYQRFV
jgi:hypothetical protein